MSSHLTTLQSNASAKSRCLR